jgi:hypothetical protein
VDHAFEPAAQIDESAYFGYFGNLAAYDVDFF